MLFLSMIYTDADNDKQFFEDLFDNYKKQMFLLAMSYLHNESDSEDAVQNTFVRIIKNSRDTVLKIENDTDMRNYLLKATKNSCIDIMRKNSKQNMDSDFTSQSVSGGPNLIDSEFVETICRKAEYEELVLMIKCLDKKYREVLYYHFVLEFSIAETSKILNQNISSTKMQLVRGKKKLMCLLNAKGDGLYVIE